MCNPVSKFVLPPSPHVPDADYVAAEDSTLPSLQAPPKPDYINQPEGNSRNKSWISTQTPNLSNKINKRLNIH